ncbi:tetratricopeptide (TPR) repeat protein [Saccharopolyspora gloriosae]|uniref:Tetratricopeptide (TPR) repeat protein n=1 Tax=Saccharopolyspora gloriosae TaxID=455344 RepID=A0A840NMQ0_9PSEU|nr:tetratricopeptide (TPR) repeat protein [Saccharopolyspora gloriosae]
MIRGWWHCRFGTLRRMSETENVRNDISGTVENALQVGVVHGDIYQSGVHQHHHHGQRLEWPCRVGVMPPRANCFQQRDLSAMLTEATGTGGTTPLSHVLAGLGGVGKTQLAAEYARQRWGDREVDLLAWITAGSREAIVSGYAAAALKVGQNTNTAERDDEEASRRFLEWLETTDRRWLLVLDDVQNPRDLNELWPPQQPTGQVLVTTRRQDSALTQLGRRIEVGLFTPAESTAYLHAKLADRSASAAGAEELAESLGFLPLALAQAAAYLNDRDLTCSAYLRRFADRRRLHELVPESESLPDAHRTTLATTWSLSVELADQLAPSGLARPLLEIAAVLDSNGIPDAVLTSPAALAYITARSGRTSPVRADDVRDAAHSLNRLSLATVDPDDPHRSVRAHALVQRATRDQLTEQHLAEVARAAADALTETWPEIEHDAGYGQILRTNTDTLRINAHDHLWNPRCHRVLFRAGASRGEAGLAAEAVNYFRHLYDHTSRLLGPDHLDALAARGDLADWQGEAGDVSGAITELSELLDDRSRVLGPDHLATLATRSNLALWRGRSGDVAGAIEEFEQLLTDRCHALGPRHPHSLTARSNLALWRGEAGDAAGAIAEYEQLLTDRTHALGHDHPDTLATRNNLAHWRGEAGDAAGAITEYEQLLTDQTEVLGPDHPRTLTARNNLANWKGRAGDVTGAISDCQLLLTAMLEVLGPDHPHTLTARSNLANWKGEAGDVTEAITEYEQLLTDRSRIQGPDHPRTLTARGNLAHWRGESGDIAGAITEYERLLADRHRLLGPDHPRTRTTRDNLAHWRGNSDAAAITEHEQLLADRSDVLRLDRPDTRT